MKLTSKRKQSTTPKEGILQRDLLRHPVFILNLIIMTYTSHSSSNKHKQYEASPYVGRFCISGNTPFMLIWSKIKERVFSRFPDQKVYFILYT